MQYAAMWRRLRYNAYDYLVQMMSISVAGIVEEPQKENELLESLQRLTKGLGLQEPHLFREIDSSLRECWSIRDEEENASYLARLVNRHIERLIEKNCHDKDAASVLRVAFNLYPKPENDEGRKTLLRRMEARGIDQNRYYAVRNEYLPKFAESLYEEPPTRREIAARVRALYGCEIPEAYSQAIL